ncbi:phosphodiester glycosidase family protein [Dysgonomonas sp. HGC4]|uniref:phosphodiester glycosidase family protein n=1 Tax=Dysgonomonas sp. HGC4 TaxID=1658009 RepID=UPI000B2AA67C|nr:phosphodiester glycosidase family protein [Dysgonomonas sp. HGC4]MBD8348797.1 phosphodiester glycosidase family protein [Dysgonomonas sp. HGC4]
MKNNNIHEDEIQILGDSPSNKQPKKSKNNSKIIIACIIAAILVTVITVIIYLSKNTEEGTEMSTSTVTVLQEKNTKATSYVEVFEETVNDVPLYVYLPHNTKIELTASRPDANDKSIIFTTQAADIGADGESIVGDFVLAGKQLAKGKSKQGFCAIIGDQISIGVDTSTPLLDETIQNNGFFFRQYPLVANGKMIENKPKGKTIRRAIGKRNNTIIIVESRSRESFYDFAQSLVDIGVTDAIYLVGGNAYGWYQDIDGKQNVFGSTDSDIIKSPNYIVFKKQNTL